MDRRCGKSQRLRGDDRETTENCSLRESESSNTKADCCTPKSLTLDGEVTLIGSANMDRRSFELNYENNILIYDPALTSEMRRRQDDYLSRSHAVTAEIVEDWPMTRQLWNNIIAMLGPVL